MPIVTPGKHFGKRLQKSKVFGKGLRKHANFFADLLITPLVDMFVIIVLFLIANFSATGEIMAMSKDIQLPTASHVQELVLVPVIMVSRDPVSHEIRVVADGKPVAESMAELERSDYMNIPALEDRLRELKKTYEAMHENSDKQQFDGNVNIQADKEVPFKVIKRVMFSCSSAGYANINFAVLNGGSGSADAAAANKT